MGSISVDVWAAKVGGSGTGCGAAMENPNPGVGSCSPELSQLCWMHLGQLEGNSTDNPLPPRTHELQECQMLEP